MSIIQIMYQKVLSIRKFFLELLVPALSGLVAFAGPAYAEVACLAEVSYRWVKEGAIAAEAAPAGAGNKAKEAPKDAPKAEPANDAASNEQRVRYATIERSGKDEGAVRAGLLIEVNRQKARAHERCKRDHESFGDCVSTKLAAKASTLNSLTFSARSKVEEALIQECQAQQGRCVAIDSGEPTCRNLGGTGEAKTASEVPGVVSDQGADQAPEKAALDKSTPKGAEPTADKAKAAKKKP